MYKEDLPDDFNGELYLQLNPDIKEHYLNNPSEHYQKYGYFENRIYKLIEIPSDFDESVYLKLNPDIKEHYLNNPSEHYQKYGYFENRVYKVVLPREFDETVYLKLNPDIKEHYLNNPSEHYQKYGYFENRVYKVVLPREFDGTIYLQLNPDIKEYYSNNPIEHYKKYGYFENRLYKLPKITIIYILCFNSEKYEQSLEIYNNYSWAKPIIMKYQDYTFENAFWKQLYEIKNEWEDCEMVGTMSYSAIKKINLDLVNDIITKKLYLPNTYYNFFDSNTPIPNFNTIKHPDFNTIWSSIIPKLNLINTTENCCNYWMCKPELMKNFIYWYNNICLPELIKNPLTLENSFYSGNDYNNAVQQSQLIELWGKPYYPNLPFICERLNKSFFITNYKIVFLISHENSVTGAVNALLNVKYFYEKNNIKTILLYLDEINKNKINVIDYIKETSSEYNCSPIVICNTFCCINIVRELSETNIVTYWYIHEWFEPDGDYKYIKNNIDLFDSSINIIFICNKSYENLKKYIPVIKNKVIIHNSISLKILKTNKNKIPEKFIYKDTNDIFLIMVGTIEKRKNHQKFIDDVFYKCVDKYPQVKLLIVGKGILDFKLNIKEKYRENIVLVGSVKNAIPYINISDIFISYSINEVFPLSILEGFYCAKPVVSSDVGGISELIENHKNGFLFNINDHTMCFQYISELIENERLRIKIGENAHKTLLEKYNGNNSMEQFLILLSKTPI
jgi:glycosyltransferase involved in cell wall biosynthesis